MSNTSLKTTAEWNTIPWHSLERKVYKLQKRIYQASQRGDTKAVRKLQKTLMRSWSGKSLAVRKVTQDNQGKKTAGVDGVKSLTPKARLTLVSNLKLNRKVKATRRVWIPKLGSSEKRPLGIPTMQDRATQALVKLALEPEWEAKFEPNSYGFRPGRSAHDAIEAIFNSIKTTAKWVIDADISKCFDKINHEKLLTKINTFPTMRRLIKAWLKAGVLDNGSHHETNEGTPQGGVISPLLANIALHGMEKVIKDYAATLTGHKKNNQQAFSLIRYADDFVIIAPDRLNMLVLRNRIEKWLANIGLELNPNKTRLVHTLMGKKYGEEHPAGFDFLSFNVKQYKVSKNNSGKSSNGKRLGFKTLIKPSDKAINKHYEEVARIIDTHKNAPQEALISKLNPVIRGWVNYYSTVVSKEIFAELKNLVFRKLKRWAERRHPKKSGAWVSKKYWHTIDGDNWVFSVTKERKVTMRLFKHSQRDIVRHIKVKGDASPFDGNLKYWSSRKGENPLVPKRVATLLKKQKGKCAHCGLYFREDDLIEIDHTIPKLQGGKDRYDNLQALHRHCHDVKTTTDNSYNRLKSDTEIYVIW
uniref:group II intron reverse transcriptase/maturase n=1 Tax=Plectonema radiosum TaxID=945768 RepID=UPI0029817CC2|nr:group II intron reverse transcriptase/maturase [Plectonema radiosum]